MNAPFQDLQKLSPVNVEGSMKAFSDWQKNLQAIATEMASYSKRSMEDGAQTLEKLMAVKSFDQVVEIQTNFVKRACDDYMQQLNKVGGMYSEFAKEATKPLASLIQQGR